ncbi:PIR Superfamily Protein [Plasmodium ovale curtisi]|uniref:PIR Superfamily Protein n=1 Tax=Plasmodium ovale curtisi TaxID=864141 RepID=A0A1A8WCY3_PLAOA|nr:PIR Superfamily Protein [Plasmodium ovale curtisi]
MTCYKNPGKESYGFFENFSFYNDHAVNAESKNSVVIKDVPEFLEEYMCPEFAEKSCYYFLINNVFPSIENPHIICEKFKYIYNLLSNNKRGGKKEGTLKNNDWAFLNYWLNDKLRSTNTDMSICVKDFYEKLRDMDEDYFKIASTDDKLFNMKKHDFENMKKLFELYNIKDKISGAIANENSQEEDLSCLWYTKECYRKYKEAIISCRGDCLYFYSLIKEFKIKYKNDLSSFAETSISCKYKELFELPDYETVLKEHKSGSFKRIITLPLLFPLLGMCFMFIFSDTLTPFRQKAFEKIKSTKNMLFGARERSNELLSYTSDNDNIIGDHEEYSIGYYSVGNY